MLPKLAIKQFVSVSWNVVDPVSIFPIACLHSIYPLTAVPSHFSFIQHTIRSKIIHVLPYLTPHNRFSPTCGDYRLELSIDLDSKTECHPTISLFHLQSSTEWSTYAHTPDTSRCPQKPTCKYYLRPCRYYYFRLVASSNWLLTEISSIDFPDHLF